ncbi:hypothetical protein BD779DRAFT_1495640 [Infundibulicybe gibba]|nr:hypothetical protein BD779DRAFT_1495640 [Infundibulicybe gibba]
MATTARQSKPARKGAPEPARRTQAWSTGARASPTFSPANNPPRMANPPPQASQIPFPPLAQTNGTRSDPAHDRIMQSLSGLTGTTVTLTTKTAQRYEGVVGSTSGEGDTTGVTLKDAKDLTNPGAPLRDQLFIAATNIDKWSSGPADAKPPNGDSFRTDADISQKKGAGRERELQAWQPTADPAVAAAAAPAGQGDDLTFGPGSNNMSWDQFDANEKLFGVKTNFDENLYTTKLDRSAPDFKERERKAQRIANEITGTGTTNPHIAEERNQNIDDSGVNEEDKYGAVVRGTNAYVPPGARKAGPLSPVGNVAGKDGKPEIPKVSVNGPDGATIPPQAQSPPSKTPSPAPSNTNKPSADPLPAFRDFVTNEKQRLTQKRQALAKSEMDRRMAELVNFSQTFKLNKPIPDDLVPILAKDEDKQRAIREKASKDASSAQAHNIRSSAVAATRGPPMTKTSADAARKAALANPASKTSSGGVVPPSASEQKVAAATTAKSTASVDAAKPPSAKPAISMFIQPIPPFKGKGKTAPASAPNGAAAPTSTASGSTPAVPSTPMSPRSAANRLNVNASSFRPNPKANAFTPGGASPGTSTQSIASASASPKPKNETVLASPTPNPFFGTRPIKKSPPVHIKDDFNPFKHNKVVEASQVSAMWPYNGKRYMQMFPLPHHQPQQHQQMVAPGPPPMPPPSYEEDAAARGYVYAYPPYGYPGQPMMPGMAPPGPPGAYMPGPFMQHMPYPPTMPPPNAMYASPSMGQMPPPQAYMPPPPGAYPPNGNGPRPSMPPTPIPAHAHAHTHPYYHQSPQLQHAVPYPMMMPPGGVPQHPYEGGGPPAPQVQMGGHA